MESRKARILCLDGGGVRGITSLLMLKIIMTEIRTQEERDTADCGDEKMDGGANNDKTGSRSTTPLKPCEYFDLICGTSTGGLIALMLGRLEYTVDEAIEQYMNFGEEIFKKKRRCFNSSKYDHSILEKCLKKVIHESHLGDENAMMKDENCRCRTFVVSAHLNKHADEDEDDAAILRSYDLQALQPAYAFHGKIWEAGRATSAAPTFFKPIEIEQRGESSNTSGVIAKASRKLKSETNKKDSYSDGGTVANNPCSIAVREAGKIWGYGNIGCIVSLGTGPEPKFTLDQATEQILGPRIMWLSQKFLSHFFYFRLQLAFYSLQKMTRTEHVHKETRDLVTTFINANGETDGQVYFRFNVESEKARVRLDAWEKMSQLQGLAIQYMGFEDVVQKTKATAAKLKKNRIGEQPPPQTDPEVHDHVVQLRILTEPPEKVEALIDISVRNNFVSKALVDKLKIPIEQTYVPAPTMRYFKGTENWVEYKSWIHFSRDGSSDHLRDNFYVLNQNPVPYELIIGSDFLKDQGSVLLKPSPLSMAAQRGDEAVIKRLLEYGVDIEARDQFRRTSLLYAIRSGRQNIVELLLENGAHVAVKDNDGQTPLLEAIIFGQEAIAKLLIEKGADIQAKDDLGTTPLHSAAIRRGTAVLKLLLEKGVDIEAKDYVQRTPLNAAAAHGHKAAVKLLLEKGADTEAMDVWGNTPLLNAAWMGKGAVVKLLVKNGVDINARGKHGLTPLSKAAEKGHTAVVKFLLKRGAHVNESELSEAGKKTLSSILELTTDSGDDMD
ncbi:F-box domain-containing protein [Metarhizium robertsii ARSEF 23]|uniref:phospholipase A2 n=1 Tax=Metarhizium robertsii (strain ARSEF 23 / ATCC MYA-3075) TaxID=655844 RepID=A0A0B2XA04_METRA|nr:F-box domain-containing protein [Metarhizium robertsii ARSEF 23]KHO11648.1 F-box domain-containing protein [Metarhizium robertsii ARSEF 23]